MASGYMRRQTCPFPRQAARSRAATSPAALSPAHSPQRYRVPALPASAARLRFLHLTRVLGGSLCKRPSCLILSGLRHRRYSSLQRRRRSICTTRFSGSRKTKAFCPRGMGTAQLTYRRVSVLPQCLRMPLHSLLSCQDRFVALRHRRFLCVIATAGGPRRGNLTYPVIARRLRRGNLTQALPVPTVGRDDLGAPVQELPTRTNSPSISLRERFRPWQSRIPHIKTAGRYHPPPRHSQPPVPLPGSPAPFRPASSSAEARRSPARSDRAFWKTAQRRT